MTWGESPTKSKTLQWNKKVHLCNRFYIWDLLRTSLTVSCFTVVLTAAPKGFQAFDWGMFQAIGLIFGGVVLLFASLSWISVRLYFEVNESMAVISHGKIDSGFSSRRRSITWRQIRGLIFHPDQQVITLKTPWYTYWFRVDRLFCTEENYQVVRDAAASWCQAANHRQALQR